MRSSTTESSSSTTAQQGHLYGASKPAQKPRHPEFSSGPCKKRPDYDLAALRTDSLGRSHRSKLGKARLRKAIDDTKRILEVPEDYLCAIVPASDTGAYEMAMWNMLGQRPVRFFRFVVSSCFSLHYSIDYFDVDDIQVLSLHFFSFFKKTHYAYVLIILGGCVLLGVLR